MFISTLKILIKILNIVFIKMYNFQLSIYLIFNLILVDILWPYAHSLGCGLHVFQSPPPGCISIL